MYVHNPFVQKEAMKHINAPEKWTEEQLEELIEVLMCKKRQRRTWIKVELVKVYCNIC